jgi:hypothetical protein
MCFAQFIQTHTPLGRVLEFLEGKRGQVSGVEPGSEGRIGARLREQFELKYPGELDEILGLHHARAAESWDSLTKDAASSSFSFGFS